jgi:hypothetical protein
MANQDKMTAEDWSYLSKKFRGSSSERYAREWKQEAEAASRALDVVERKR